jgi:CheY-like chemotaxis protein
MERLALIIDDDVPSRLIYVNMLRALRFQTLEAGDGLQAIDILQSQQPSVIFLDLLLPKKNGLELLDYIYSAPHLVQAHVIIITAHINFKHDLNLRPGDQYFLKPIALAEIRETIQLMMQNEPG